MSQQDAQYLLTIYWIDGGEVSEALISNQSMFELLRDVDSSQIKAFYKFTEIDGTQHRVNRYKINHIEITPQ